MNLLGIIFFISQLSFWGRNAGSADSIEKILSNEKVSII